MKRIKLINILVVLLCCCFFTACGTSKNSALISSDDDPNVQAILEYFEKLSEIPRGTYNEQEVSNYLKSWGEENGFTVVQDKNNNIIYDVPATKGNENSPLIAFQTHMDMVVVSDDNSFCPDTDPIIIKRSGNELTADGTSLGADDGIGISIIQNMVVYNKNHGPMRIIITTDEESTQTGAQNIDAKYFNGVAGLINLDYENSSEICISSASAVTITGRKTLELIDNTYDACFTLTISGSDGGHSGLEIQKNRMNSIIELYNLLDIIKENGIDFSIVEINGGTVINAIPTEAKAVIVCAASDETIINTIADEQTKHLLEKYGETNSAPCAQIQKNNETPKQALSSDDTDRLICFGSTVNDGVYAMSQKREGLVETSTNLGIVQCSENSFFFQSLLRSSENEREQELLNSTTELANTCGISTEIDYSCAAWPIKENNSLEKLVASIYEKQNGEKPQTIPVHAGLECGWFAAMNPDMEIISIGPDIISPHSVNESCKVDSLLKISNLLDEVLAEYCTLEIS